MTDEESIRFRQIVILGVRNNVRGAAVDANKRQLQSVGLYGSYQELPELATDACEPYRVPSTSEAELSYAAFPTTCSKTCCRTLERGCKRCRF